MVYFIGGWAICYLIWDVRRRLNEHEKKEEGLELSEEAAAVNEENTEIKQVCLSVDNDQ